MVLLYIKEINSIKEIFNKKYPKWLNYVIYFAKFIFCIITVKNEDNCYIPYKNMKNKFAIKLTVIMIKKQNCKVILSKHLLENEQFMKQIINENIEYLEGEVLFDFNILNILKYIAKIQKKELKSLEISVLINNTSEESIRMIKYLAMNLKRVNIVTKQIEKFRKVEEELQGNLGIPILVTNSKRKSLLKVSIIVNIDFSIELLELYQINRSAIIIQKQKQNINKKSFGGVNVIDHEIIFEEEKVYIDFYKNFRKKDLLLSMVDVRKNYVEVVEQLEKYNTKVINLVGNKGIISNMELVSCI